MKLKSVSKLKDFKLTFIHHDYNTDLINQIHICLNIKYK